ncbi:Peroxiredoxin [Flavobacteriaceae bacterium MAR_2010_188]|nr:Peroxiredoxin [Flavobacteriaceae bacterium MAR_2010_188]
MKNLVSLLLICIVFISCKNETENVENRDSYVINGSAPGVYNGVRVYLKSADQRDRFMDLDTAIVMGEKFTFEGTVDSPERLTLHVNSVNGSVPIILENAVIDVRIDKDDITNSEVKGTKANDALFSYAQETRDFMSNGVRLNNEYRTALRENDTAKLNSMAMELQSANKKQLTYPLEFIEKHPDNYFSLILLQDLYSNKQYPITDLETAHNNISAEIKNSYLGKIVDSIHQTRVEESKRLASLEVGNVAPKFSGPTPDGKTISLDGIKGKATIIDFWAAWCGPCRRENPNVVRIYNKYHAKGLEIVGVSLDGNGRQTNPKEAWMKAIKDDNLSWNHISNLNYFNDPVAKLYNITSIPATYILDENGTIVAKNLRGQELEMKIAELLK